MLTYKKSGLDEVVKQIDIKHIVLETDAPYLTPVPFRGKRNESSYIKIIAEKLAAIKNISLGRSGGNYNSKRGKNFQHVKSSYFCSP